MNRIEEKFQELKKEDRKALITYITAGDPSVEMTEQLVYAQERGGSDMIELGIPFSDPLADGPVIQAAAQRALQGGVSLEKIFNCVRNIRRNSNIPLAFLVYYNTILHFGVQQFIDKCDEIGVDGLIVPDLPLEEREEMAPYLEKAEVVLIPLVAPTSKQRIKKVVSGCKGFVYCVSSLGVTGKRNGFYEHIDTFLKEVRGNTELPLAVGFGISSKEDVQRLQPYVDGVIVGSAIVKKVEETKGEIREIEAFVKGIRPTSY